MKNIDAMHQRSPLKKCEEKSDNTVKLCLSNLKFRLQNTILMIPNLKFMTLNLFLPSPNVMGVRTVILATIKRLTLATV